MPPSMIALLLCLAFGGTSWFLGHFVARRKFYRRNIAGIEEFPSYRSAALNTAFESALAVIAKLFGGFGVGLLLMFVIMKCGGADDPPWQNDGVVRARAVRRYHGNHHAGSEDGDPRKRANTASPPTEGKLP